MRVDVYLHRYGYTQSRKKAQDAIDAGAVTIDGYLIAKSSTEIDEIAPHQVEILPVCPFVGRGGLKLAGALDAFHISVKDVVAVDIGASTGGFTDCLLQRGARRVYAIDAGVDQLAHSLREDSRVICIERFNARELSFETIGEYCDLAVMDVSFISQTYLLPGTSKVLKGGARLISLIKPQFEAGRSAIGKNGIVRTSAYRFLAVKRVLHTAETLGLCCVGLIRSPIKGGDGNIEYLAMFENAVKSSPLTDTQIKRIVDRD